jgi:uncharacterized membrane protein
MHEQNIQSISHPFDPFNRDVSNNISFFRVWFPLDFFAKNTPSITRCHAIGHFLNLHPLIVHFPIALITVGAICDAIGILGKRTFFQKMGYFLFSLGALSGIIAALTGENAAEVAQHINGIAQDLDQHNTLGTATAYLSIALVIGRTHFTLKKKFGGVICHIYLFFALMTVALVSASGYTGGHLVYRYGAGTEPVVKTLHIPEESLKQTPRVNTFESVP